MRGLSAVDCGYRWIAEWESHEATWISWPYRETTWPGRLHAIPPVTERVIRTLAEVEKVHVLGGPSESSQALKIHRIAPSFFSVGLITKVGP